VEVGQHPLSLSLAGNLQPLPHKILSSLVEVRLAEHIMIKWIFTTHWMEVGALQLSLNLVGLLQPLLLEILFSLEVVVIQLVLPMLLMCLM
jgi:hypothetical protein